MLGGYSTRQEYMKAWNIKTRQRTKTARYKNMRRLWALANPDRVKAIQKRWYLKHGKNDRLKRQYGITLNQYNALLKSQNGCCGICGTQEPGNNYKALKYFQVDHNHHTGAVRGLLCNNCNRAIGLLHDNPAFCRKAAFYLEEKECLS